MLLFGFLKEDISNSKLIIYTIEHLYNVKLGEYVSDTKCALIGLITNSIK